MSSARPSGRLSVKPPRRPADYAGVIRFVVFSKDRPAQLDLLLRSVDRFVPAGVHRLRADHQAGRANHSRLLMGVISTQLWHEQFIGS